MENGEGASRGGRNAKSINQTTNDTVDLLALTDWMGVHLKTSSLIPHNFADTGRGMQATGDIPPGTRLISVGSPFCYTAHAARRLHPEIPLNLLKHPIECLTMFLMLEDELGAESVVAPYVKSLPRSFTNPLFTLAGRIPDGICADMEALLRRQRRELSSSWKIISAAFAHLDGARREEADMKRFIWAWFAVATRTLYVNPQEPALVPYLDLFNHSPEAKVETRWNDKEEAFEIYTECAYLAGQQVFINYGAHDNMKLAVYYGFTVPLNSLSEVRIDLHDVLKKLPITLAQEEFLKSYGAWRPLTCSWTGFHPTSTLYLRVRLVSNQDLWKCMDDEELPNCEETRRALVLLLEEKWIVLGRHASNVSFVCPLLHAVYSEQLAVLVKNLTACRLNASYRNWHT